MSSNKYEDSGIIPPNWIIQEYSSEKFRPINIPNPRLEEFQIDIYGNLYNMKTDCIIPPKQYVRITGRGNKRYFLQHRLIVGQISYFRYNASRLVAETWWKEDEDLWIDSPFVDTIGRHMRFHYEKDNGFLRYLGTFNSKKNFKYYASAFGYIWNETKRAIVPGTINKYGYRKITLDYRAYSIHRLICQAFHRIPERLKRIPMSQLQVNHIDRNTCNNKPENLEWCTPRENSAHSWKFHDRKDNKKEITDEQMRMICEELVNGKSDVEIARMVNRHPDTIGSIRRLHLPKYREWHAKYKWKPWKYYLRKKVPQIIKLFLSGVRPAQISKILHVHTKEIGQILTGRLFPEATKKYRKRLNKLYEEWKIGRRSKPK